MKDFVNIKFVLFRFVFLPKHQSRISLFWSIFIGEKKVYSQIYVNLDLHDKITLSPIFLKETCVYFCWFPTESWAIKANSSTNTFRILSGPYNIPDEAVGMDSTMR